MVEAMIVIIIVGVMTALAGPPFFRYLTSNRLQTGTDRLVSDLQYARSLSVSSSEILRFTATAGGYRVTNPISGAVIRETNFDHGLNLAAVATTDFYPWGMADPVVLTLSNTAGNKQISVLPTGIVEVQ
jgi:type II secretory pathway pseudopilin PulG